MLCESWGTLFSPATALVWSAQQTRAGQSPCMCQALSEYTAPVAMLLSCAKRSCPRTAMASTGLR